MTKMAGPLATSPVEKPPGKSQVAFDAEEELEEITPLMDILKHSSRTSSCNGVPNIHNARNHFRRFIWCVLVAIGTGEYKIILRTSWLGTLPGLLALCAGSHSVLVSFSGEHPPVTVGFPSQSFSNAVLWYGCIIASKYARLNFRASLCLKSPTFKVPQPFWSYTELQTSCDYIWIWFRHQENYYHLFLPWNIIDIVDILNFVEI